MPTNPDPSAHASSLPGEQPPQGEQHSRLLPIVIPPMIERSQAAFRRDLPELMKTHYRQWVAYHGDERLGFGRSQTALYQECFRRGLQEDEFVVRSIEPEMPDEIDADEFRDV
jgi:hypothetical protein